MAKKKIHVFWSGGDPAKVAAQSYCQANNCVMLEMTHKVCYMEKVMKKERREQLKRGKSPNEIYFQNELPKWEKLSMEYAMSSPHKDVHVFINVSYKEPEDMMERGQKKGEGNGKEYHEKPWLNDFYYGWNEEDYQKFRTLFPNDEIPKQFKECNYDRRKSVLHRVEHPILKDMKKNLIIHYVK